MDKIKHIMKHEGCISHMYLDTNKFVTCGVGFLISSKSQVTNYPFYCNTTNQLASLEQKQNEYQVISQCKPAMLPRYYKRHTTLHIKQHDIDAILQQKITEFEKLLLKPFPMYNSYIQPVQLALLDMAFNLGVNGVKTKFPTFTQAIIDNDWDLAIKQSYRRDVSKSRNDDVAALISLAM